MYKPRNNQNEDNKNQERILHLRRVSKKTTGGNYISFSALVAIGDGEGNVGIGIGRGLEVPPAIKKAITQAKKHMIHIPIFNDTLPHQVILKFKSSRLLLKPAPPGTGLKVGGVVRAILDIAGVNNASGKIIGTRNQITNAYATMEALKKLKARIGPASAKDTASKEKKEKKSEEVAPVEAVQTEIVAVEPVKVEAPNEEKKPASVSLSETTTGKEVKVKAASAKATASRRKK